MDDKITLREKAFCIIGNDVPMLADVIVILEGDGFNRIAEGARLYKEKFAPLVVISGGIVNPPHSYPANEMKIKLIEKGVPNGAIVLDELSMNTRDQGVNIMILAKERRWKRIILVASNYHQYRAYLTFLQAMNEAKLKLILINAPSRNLSWFQGENGQSPRVDLLEGEVDRLVKYAPQGHVASYQEALDYFQWRETQI